MTKYTLICEHGDGSKVTHEFKEEGLEEVLSHLSYFLRGASFVIDTFAILSFNDNASKWRLEQKSGKKNK